MRPTRDTSCTKSDERRRILRLPATVGLMYSGMDSGRMLIADGMTMNLSQSGMAVTGTRLVRHGMDLAPFIDLPGSEEPVCISEGQVSWVAGHRFGVKLVTVHPEARDQLRFFLWNHWNHGQQSVSTTSATDAV